MVINDDTISSLIPAIVMGMVLVYAVFLPPEASMGLGAGYLMTHALSFVINRNG